MTLVNTRGYANPLGDPVAGMQNNLGSRRHAGKDLRHPIVPVSDLDDYGSYPPVLGCEYRPILAFPEQGGYRRRSGRVGAPCGNMNDHPVVMAEP